MSTQGELSGVPLPRRYKPGDLDFFIEPRWSVDLLLDVEEFTGPVLDPACGSGTIVKACLDRGIMASGSDIAGRGFGGVQDFLSDDFRLSEVPSVAQLDCPTLSIICNPPFGLAAAFICRALGIASEKVAMLVQSKFPYSQGRYPLFSQHPPARLYFLSNRPSMPPGEKLIAGTVKPEGGKLDYMWMVWEGHLSPGSTTEASWLRRPA